MRVALVNLPFSSLQLPSIALHQLEAVTRERFGAAVEVEVHYLNHDFGALIGPELYAWISESHAGHTSGFGEWFFRQAAFPEAPDNEAEYLARYHHHFTRSWGADWQEHYRRELAPLRAELPRHLDGMIARHGLDRAELVGITSMFFQNLPGFALARRLKEGRAAATVVMGGANCEATMGIEMLQRVPWLDYVFSGHALESFPRFLAALMAGDEAGRSRIDGVFSRANTRPAAQPLPRPGAARAEERLAGTMITAVAAERPLGATPEVEYDGYLDSYARHFGDHGAERIELLFETSRGCWWGEKAHCNFCGLNGATMSFRELEVERARERLQRLIDRYAGRVRRFAAVDNIIPRAYVEELLPRLAVPAEVTLFYEIRADLDRQRLHTLARARVVEVQPGIESLSTPTLKRMRKGSTAFNNLRFLADCAAEGVRPVWNLLVGFPGEEEESYTGYLENLPRLHHLPPPSGVFPVRFDRFSPYFIHSDEFGLDLAPLDYLELIYPFPAEATANLAYYFRDRRSDAPYQVTLARHLGRLGELVARWNERWHAPGGPPRLRLTADTEGWLVEDSRSGHRLEHELAEEDVALLRRLARPQSESMVREEDPEGLEYLLELGLLFRERGRVMSLVEG